MDGVSFDVHQGQTLGLVGESGSGKTTLARTILRLVPAREGSVHFRGVDLLHASRAQLRDLRRDVQMVFQDPLGTLNPRMTAEEIIAEPLRIHRAIHGTQLRSRVAALLEHVQLSPGHARRYPHELSGGQRQRIGIARAIALSPRLLLCDEPVSALDVSVQAQILNLLVDLKATLGLTYLLISHNLAVVEHMSQQLAVMYRGRIVERGPTDRVFARPAHPYTQALLASAVLDGRRQEATPRRSAATMVLLPQGCPYCPLCSIATERCASQTPESRPADAECGAHVVACHYPEEAGRLREQTTIAHPPSLIGPKDR